MDGEHNGKPYWNGWFGVLLFLETPKSKYQDYQGKRFTSSTAWEAEDKSQPCLTSNRTSKPYKITDPRNAGEEHEVFPIYNVAKLRSGLRMLVTLKKLTTYFDK